MNKIPRPTYQSRYISWKAPQMSWRILNLWGSIDLSPLQIHKSCCSSICKTVIKMSSWMMKIEQHNDWTPHTQTLQMLLTEDQMKQITFLSLHSIGRSEMSSCSLSPSNRILLCKAKPHSKWLRPTCTVSRMICYLKMLKLMLLSKRNSKSSKEGSRFFSTVLCSTTTEPINSEKHQIWMEGCVPRQDWFADAI